MCGCLLEPDQSRHPGDLPCLQGAQRQGRKEHVKVKKKQDKVGIGLVS